MNKVAVITGSTSGIGLGIAREFAKAGYNLLFNGLEKDGADIAAGVGKEFGVQTIFSGANMLKVDEIQGMIKLAETTFGKVDVLINNAGIQFVSPVEDFPEAKWDAILGINLSAAFHASKAVWPGMKSRKFGRIINVASAHGLRASEFKAAYVAAKHGVVGLTKVLGLEGAPYNITCNAICPGYVRTPLVENQIKDQAKSAGIPESEVIEKIMLKKQAVKDFISLEAMGQLALYLSSDFANTFTGVAIPVDGGWTAQ